MAANPMMAMMGAMAAMSQGSISILSVKPQTFKRVMDGRTPAFAFYVALALKELFLGNGPLMSVNQL